MAKMSLKKPLLHCLVCFKKTEAILFKNKICDFKGSFSGNGVVTIGTQEKIWRQNKKKLMQKKIKNWCLMNFFDKSSNFPSICIHDLDDEQMKWNDFRQIKSWFLQIFIDLGTLVQEKKRYKIIWNRNRSLIHFICIFVLVLDFTK